MQTIILEVGYDVSEILNIVKYEPLIPAHLAGKVKGFFPGFLRKTDEERIQNCADLLEKHRGEIFYITEKLDGASVTIYKKNGELGVCSRNLELLDTEDNTIWKIAKEKNLQEKLLDNFAIQGEIIGEGIQKNPLKSKGQELYAFNVYDIKNQRYLDFGDFITFCYNINIKIVPILDNEYVMNHTIETILKSAEGPSLLNPNVNREGIVVRPIKEDIDEINGSMSRLSFKVVSNDYLLTNEQ